MEFVDGVLKAVYIECPDGKDGWGEDCSMPIEESEFYGMTVEEIAEDMEAKDYKVEIS